MSIKDYSRNYVLINGVTNEHIKIPKAQVNSRVLKDLTLNELMLFETLMCELVDSDSVTVTKTYMKD